MSLTFFSAKARIAELEANIVKLTTENAQLTTDISALRLENSTQAAALAGAIERAKKAESGLEAAASKQAETEKSVDAKASAKALEITGSAGSTAITDEGVTKSQAELVEEFNAITDPGKRGEFYAKHFAKKFTA